MGNAHPGDAASWLVRQHEALQRVATLVARQPPTAEVFELVTREACEALGARMSALLRVESAGEGIMIAGWSTDGTSLPVGSRGALDGRGLLGQVLRTGQRVRLDDFDEAGGAVAAQMRDLDVPAGVAGPIVIGGRIWGALTAAWPPNVRMPSEAQDRLAAFAELVAYAIDNAETRDELVASRARLVEAADEQRRRVVRDLHDGAQQRMVSALMTLQQARDHGGAPPEVGRLVTEALADTRAALDGLRELARGIHPAILTHRGLAAAVASLADRAPVPVHIDIPDDRYHASVEAAAYFVAAEALTNIAKYARASMARITATTSAGTLVLLIEDDGVGGAAPSPESGLSGLQDRVAASRGTLTIDSPLGEGTRIRAKIPLDAAHRAHAVRSASEIQ